jgi:hypothetical protein
MLKAVENGEPKGRFFESDEIARAGARRILIAALDAEAADYVERHRHERDDEGRALCGAQRPSADTQAYAGGRWSRGRRRANDCRRPEQGSASALATAFCRS